MAHRKKGELTQLIEKKAEQPAEDDFNSTHDTNFPKQPFTRQQKITLCLLSAVEFVRYFSLALLPPFFPKMAEEKGISQKTIGFIFSFHALVMVIICPIVGKLLPVIRVKLAYILGILAVGISNICFGYLENIENHNLFIISVFAVRLLEGVGTSTFSTASYVIVFNTFPDNSATVRGIMEMFVGLGLSFGPAFGGLFVLYWGYALPFYVIGVITLLLLPLSLVFFELDENSVKETTVISWKSLLKLPASLVNCLIIIVVSITWNFTDPILEPSLRKFELPPTYIGLIFLLQPAIYSIVAPIVGFVTDRMNNYWILMSCGLFSNCIAAALLGPSQILPFIQDSLVLKIMALCILGFSIGNGFLPTYQGLLDSGRDGGLGSGLAMHSLVSGLWYSQHGLGELIGPALGGLIMHYWGFSITCTVIAAINLVTAVGVTVFFSLRKKSNVV